MSKTNDAFLMFESMKATPHQAESAITQVLCAPYTSTPAACIDVAFLRNGRRITFGRRLPNVVVPQRAPIWLDSVYSLVARGQTDEAIDLLFERVDSLLCAGDFRGCDDILRTIDVKRLDTNLLIALLSVTKAARLQLSARPSVVEQVERRLGVVAPGRVGRLMEGLR